MNVSFLPDNHGVGVSDRIRSRRRRRRWHQALAAATPKVAETGESQN